MSVRLLELADQLDADTLRQVFTHSSLVVERGRSYERFEFLGDSVLSLCITTELYRRFPSVSEGHLARLRAYIVSRATCCKVANRLGLGKMMRQHSSAGRDGNELVQLSANENVLADLTESLIGALYLAFGLGAVRPAVVEVFDEHIQYAEKSYVDHKTELQEHLARVGKNVTYRVLGFSGPPHDREFEIEAVVDGEVFGHGSGASKKRAEQEAAAEVLKELALREQRQTRRVRLHGRRGRRGGAGASGAGSADSADSAQAATGAQANTGVAADATAESTTVVAVSTTVTADEPGGGGSVSSVTEKRDSTGEVKQDSKGEVKQDSETDV